MKTLKRILGSIAAITFVFLCVQCKNETKKKEGKEDQESVVDAESLEISKSAFGKLPSGEEIDEYTLENSNGMEVSIITYGGIITALKIPNKSGKIEDVVLGYGSLESYLKSSPYFGALIGRYGNRIANGKFSIDGKEYTLAQNDGKNHLHGGEKGFDKVVWEATQIKNEESVSLQLSYLSKDMEEGYPGNLKTTVVYTLDDSNTLNVSYEAETDKKTVVNLTQHSYFNLSGDFSKDILDHEVVINADAFLPVDETLIPTGELTKVADTPFDFITAKTIGKEINAEDEQLKRGKGYDHCWVLNDQDKGMRFAASAYHKESGRFMEVYTDEPGIQFYTGNFLDGTLPAKNGGTYAHRTGFCLETQHYPDSPNQTDFPTVILNPGETYKTKTSFKFSVK
ncbi:galactose mutarotase [Galbibacter sp. EGI 63066]|uniref:aldose epimerase family protein n=1 Tax=Galbibacter sp. EGI 63066 TaxID=2993559 RepID=UPI0022491195|nr:aldose epimerase family protein [Galbibacter sp. EGI 63066]MCX2680474.1 galactose mutarotase [Galbibacter sp. EGI 63066]